MNSNRSILTGLLFGLLALAGCSADKNPTSAPQLTPAKVASNALKDAPHLVALAASGVRDRGEQDEMLRVEGKVPGFGGFYIDSDGAVVIYLKQESAAVQSAIARTAVHNQYVNRSELNVREIMSRASDAQIRMGLYSLSELIAVEYRIASSPGSIPGLVGWGTSIYKNRVVAGFKDSTSMLNGIRSLSQWGIPASAVVGEVWGEIHALSNWNSFVRPTRGGIEIGIINRTRFHPSGDSIIYSGGGSLGYNVRTPAGVQYLMTASHVVTEWTGTNGALGDTVLQPGILSGAGLSGIGTMTINPPWNQGAACPERDTVAHIRFDYCTRADVALGSYINVLPDREVGTSDYEGENGKAGCCNGHIHTWTHVQGVLAPEFVIIQQDSARSKGVHKSGSTTGTTTGVIGVPLVSVISQLCWGTTPAPSGGRTGCASRPWVLFQHQTQVLHMGIGEGDSGGPVFYGNATPYSALGITSSANSLDPNTKPQVCTAGLACTMYFSRWDEIELLLGLTLNPSTVQ